MVVYLNQFRPLRLSQWTEGFINENQHLQGRLLVKSKNGDFHEGHMANFKRHLCIQSSHREKRVFVYFKPAFFFRSYLLDNNVIHADVKRPRKSRIISIGHVVLI